MSVAVERPADTNVSTSTVSTSTARTSAHTLTSALETIATGGSIVLVTEPRTVNLVFAARYATTELTAFAVAHTSGFLCVALSLADCDRLHLPPMVWGNSSTAGYAVTADASEGIGTGISAADRAQTILTMSRAHSEPADLTRPGHVVPYRVSENLGTQGAPAGALRLVELAGCRGGAAFAALLDTQGSGNELDDNGLQTFSDSHGLPVVRYRAGVPTVD